MLERSRERKSKMKTKIDLIDVLTGVYNFQKSPLPPTRPAVKDPNRTAILVNLC